MRSRRDKRHWWLVPVTHAGRDCDVFWIRAHTEDEAQADAEKRFASHGYTRATGYDMEIPIRSDDL